MTRPTANQMATGPWIHQAEPIYPQDGGHGMLFTTSDGALMNVLHCPNGPGARPRIFEMEDTGDILRNCQGVHGEESSGHSESLLLGLIPFTPVTLCLHFVTTGSHFRQGHLPGDPCQAQKTRFLRFIGPGNVLVECALKRHVESSGGNPDRQCSSQPEALGAAQEVTNGLKHSKTRLR
jgi:hypothetical protein